MSTFGLRCFAEVVDGAALGPLGGLALAFLLTVAAGSKYVERDFLVIQPLDVTAVDRPGPTTFGTR